MKNSEQKRLVKILDSFEDNKEKYLFLTYLEFKLNDEMCETRTIDDVPYGVSTKKFKGLVNDYIDELVNEYGWAKIDLIVCEYIENWM